MSKELEQFQRVVKNSQLLILAMNTFDNIRVDLENELSQQKTTAGSLYQNYQFKDLRKEFIESVLTSQIALLQAALEGYSIVTSGGHKDMSSKCIIQHAPYYKLKVDPGSKEYHVAEIAKDIRDKRLHSLPDPYNTIQTNLLPMELLSQSVVVEEYPNKRVVHFLLPGQTAVDYHKQELEKSIANHSFSPVSNKLAIRHMAYINLLEEELLKCVEANDNLRLPAGGYRKTVMSQADYVPIEYV